MSSSGTRILRLGDVCRKIGSGATPRGGQSVYTDDGEYALIRSQNVYNEGFYYDGLAYIGPEHAEQLENVVIEPDDILLNITGDSVARCCMVNNDVLPARVNQHVSIIRPDPSILDPRFLRYYLVSPSMQAKLLSWADSGGTRKALTKGMIESFEIEAPALPEQRAIAHVLGTLDDKIELNRRMNETLEGMARALFKSWFVDFDPVRAKMAGRPTGLPPALDALFPDALVESALGGIPVGWEVESLGEVADVSWGDTSVTKKAYVEDGFVAYSASGPDGFLPYADFDRTGVVVSAIGANAGLSWLASGKWSCIKNTIRYWATSEDLTTEYLFYATYGKRKWPMRGSAQPFISQGDARNLKIMVPGNNLARKFTAILAPAMKRNTYLNYEGQTLAGIRDSLLPKLISGELRMDVPANE